MSQITIAHQSGGATPTAPAASLSTIFVDNGGDVKKINSAGAISSLGGGKVLQVIQAMTDVGSTSSATSLTGTGLSASITPSSASSKVLVTVSLSAGSHHEDNHPRFGLTRNGTDVGNNAQTLGARSTCIASTNRVYDNFISTVTYFHLDSPASTSSISYEATAANRSGYYLAINRTWNDTDAQWTNRATSTITLTEIAT